jgi:hypothetical protein
MPFASQRAAPEIESQVAAHQRAMNSSRYIPETPDIYRQIAEANKVYIFNVGPWTHRRELGSAGTFVVRACPAGQEYSEPVVLKGVVEEPYPINEVECKIMPTEGMVLAMQVIGEGPFIPKSSSFVPFGVFISTDAKPSPKDLVIAKNTLQRKYLELIHEANTAFSNGPNAVNETIRPEWHFVAARALKRTEAECPWLKGTEVGPERQACPGCGTVYSTGVMKCRTCGFITDKKRYDDAVAKGLFAT